MSILLSIENFGVELLVTLYIQYNGLFQALSIAKLKIGIELILILATHLEPII